MKPACSLIEHCFAPELPCHMGCDEYAKCQYWKARGGADGSSPDAAVESDSQVHGHQPFWTGRVMGLVDALPVAARNPTMLVGIIGAHDAGKTSFLLGLYCLVAGGKTLGGFRFAGSYSLLAWELLASYARYSASHPASFPPHTPDSTDRIPGLFHLAVRGPTGHLHDSLFAHAPGEWFTNWSVKADDPRAAGARWVADHADGFLLFADSFSLSGADRGTAAGNLIQLMQRVSVGLGPRPLGFLWAKSDVTIKDEIRSRVDSVRRRLHSRSFVRSVSVRDPAKHSVILDSVEHLVKLMLAGNAHSQIPAPSPGFPNDGFLSLRGSS